MSFTKTFLTGLAQWMSAHDVGVYKDPGPYLVDDVAIAFGEPPQQPSRVISLTAYDVDNDPTMSTSTLGVQMRFRGAVDPIVSEDMADLAFDLLHGAHDYNLPNAIRITQSYSRSRVSGGKDAEDRWSTIQNFYFDLWRPSPHRP